MEIASLGIDLGKTTFHLVALGERNKVLVRKKFSRAQLLAYTLKIPSALIGIEACAGSHFMGAKLREQGHEVRLIPAQFVKPYRKSNKNDFQDAEAIAEAVRKENMRFVPIKTQEQLDIQGMHRVRDRLVQRRTALINEIRGFLLDRGITFAADPQHLRKNLPAVIEDAEQNLTPRLRWLLDRMWQEWKQLELNIETMSDELERISEENELCRRLRQIPGFGPLVSTATVAAIGNGAAFQCGRDFAAWVGVVPRQYSTGGKQKLLGISQAWQPLSASHADPRGSCRTVSRHTIPEDSGSGFVGWPSVHHAIKWLSPSLTSWLAWPGPCCPAAKSTSTSGRRRPQRKPIGPWKRGCAWKA
jgi:transposase